MYQKYLKWFLLTDSLVLSGSWTKHSHLYINTRPKHLIPAPIFRQILMTRTVNAAFDVQPSLAELNNNLFPHKRGSGCPWKIISLRSESVQHHVLFMLWNEQPTKLDQVFFAAIVRCFEGDKVQTADFVDWNWRRDEKLKTPELERHRATFQSKAGRCSRYTAATSLSWHTLGMRVCVCVYEKKTVYCKFTGGWTSAYI